MVRGGGGGCQGSPKRAWHVLYSGSRPMGITSMIMSAVLSLMVYAVTSLSVSAVTKLNFGKTQLRTYCSLSENKWVIQIADPVEDHCILGAFLRYVFRQLTSSPVDANT